MARLQESGKIDVERMIVGDVSFADVVSALGKAEKVIEREINPTVYTPSEFQLKLSKGHHFLKALMNERKPFLIGDQRELARLAKKRLAD